MYTNPNNLLEMMASGAPLESVLVALVHQAESQSDDLTASVVLVNPENGKIEHCLPSRLPAEFSEVINTMGIGPVAGCCGTAIYNNEPIVVSNTAAHPLWRSHRELVARHGMHAAWSLPIRSRDGAVLGAFTVYCSTARHPTTSEMLLAEMGTHVLSIALERERAEDRIRFIARHDMLTGLPNRLSFPDCIAEAIGVAHRFNRKIALLFVDLDHFKHINDTLGHSTGDLLLKMAAGRLRSCLRSSDTLARLGGDEFVIMLTAINNCTAPAAVAQKAIDAMNAPFMVAGHELHIGASIGISIYPNDGRAVEMLMSSADAAMFQAKRRGRGNYQFFTSGLNAVAQRRLLIETQLHQAIAQNELSVYFQPQLDIATRSIRSAEALIRWNSSTEGPVSPSEFIPIAEETGLILQIGSWVLREACLQVKRWRDAGHMSMTVAVNISARQVVEPGFVLSVRKLLEELHLPASALELEITESLLMDSSDISLEPLHELNEMGIQLSIDDFGTGYSSLSRLRCFPIHALKIDQSFIKNIGHDSSDTAIVLAIIAMAKSLQLKVIAEGVEKVGHANFLRSHGCSMAQGFLYSQAIEADQLSMLLDMPDAVSVIQDDTPVSKASRELFASVLAM
jgi:diguanylate cyclase (GGDEF)-like protein